MDHHINRHFDEMLEELKEQILKMGNGVLEMVEKCTVALKNYDTNLAQKIIKADGEIDALEIAIDERCTHLLACYQPAAGDLRFITRGLKIVTDLERIGDLAVNFAERIMEIKKNGPVDLDIQKMASTVFNMLKKSFDAFLSGDVKKAQEVLEGDDIVDEMTEKYVTEILRDASKNPSKINALFSIASIVRYLERVADHATNIAETTVYMIKGRDIRHGLSH